MYYNLTRRLLRWRIYLILGLSLLAMVIGRVGLGSLGSRACRALPAFRAEVPAELRQELGLLQEAGLLYCKPLRAGLAAVDPMVYWGSDGLSSLLFFQAAAGADLSAVGLGSYRFSDGQNQIFPSRPGDGRPAGFLQAREGDRVWSNQASGEAPTYYLRREGAPGAGVGVVMVEVSAPMVVDENLTDRDFLQDLEHALDWLRGRAGVQGGASGRGTRDLNFLIDRDRWSPYLQRDTNPAFQTAEGAPDLTRLSREPLSRPQIFQRVQGLLGSSVWVAGAISGTQGALLLQEQNAVAGEAGIQPRDQHQWRPLGPGSAMELYAFPSLPAGRPFEALYWSDAADQAGGRPPDQRFVVAFPLPSAQATATAGAAGAAQP